ncbi:MAG: ABC transporter ATP-binding protein [Thermodesulfobacteriota bacterium]|nr:ABC transporter ATP-binding protein [Thermodesulfobacteriota bacterium]
MIRIENLRKTYGKIQALSGIDLHVPAGELFAYLGPNGAGKTTTIRILTGLTRLSAGAAALNGHDIAAQATAAKRQCGLVPQHINLDSELTVGENMDLHGRLFGMPAALRKQRITELLDYVELSDRVHSLVKQLSGGLKRRVMIARALLHNPRILFLDEPTVGLDPAIRRRIWSLVKQIQQQGTTIFLTTHYIEEAEFLADRVAFLESGRIVAVDSPTALMAGVGHWAVDWVTELGMQSGYFPSREAAQAAGAARHNGFTLRRVNLEDAFLTLTGKKVATDANAQTVHGQGHGAHAPTTHNPTGAYAKKGD